MNAAVTLTTILIWATATGVAAQQVPDSPTEPMAEAPREPMPVPRALAGHRGQRPIYIDGVLQDWPDAPPLDLSDPRQLSGTALGAWRGPDDLMARVFLLWDADDLYVAAVVRDDWHRALTKDSPRLLEIPPADSIVLTFDPRRDTRAMGADPGREEDREYWLADVEGQGRQVVLWDRFRGTARYGDGAVAVVKREPERFLTTYEARLPWKEILPAGMSPTPGLVFDLQVVVNDYDEITDTMPQTRMGWTFGAGPRIDPGLLGSVQLVGELKEAVTAMPEFPSPPRSAGDPVPGPAHWVALLKQLKKSEPVVVTSDSEAPRSVLGAERADLLEELEREAAAFPRVDFLDYHQRAHRRMRRESAGMIETGLPFFWQYALEDVGRRATEPPPESGFRIFRLPVGGWLVRSNSGNFGIDPAGYDLGRHAFGAFDFILLTDPGEMTKRNDQILLRMASSNRPFYTHRAFHLPGVDASKMPLVTLGETHGTTNLRVRLLGARSGELVTPSAGLVVEWPDGTVLVHSGTSLMPEQLDEVLPASHQVDLLILSAKHPQAATLGRSIGARLTVLDDVLQCSTRAGAGGRVPLEDAFALQTALRPNASVILAPGESLDVPAR